MHPPYRASPARHPAPTGIDPWHEDRVAFAVPRRTGINRAVPTPKPRRAGIDRPAHSRAPPGTRVGPQARQGKSNPLDTIPPARTSRPRDPRYRIERLDGAGPTEEIDRCSQNARAEPNPSDGDGPRPFRDSSPPESTGPHPYSVKANAAPTTGHFETPPHGDRPAGQRGARSHPDITGINHCLGLSRPSRPPAAPQGRG